MHKTSFRTILILVSGLFLFSCSGKKVKSDLDEKKMFGKVKTVTESTYSVVEKFGEVEKGFLTEKSVITYTTSGKEIENSIFNIILEFKISYINLSPYILFIIFILYLGYNFF